MPLRSLVSHSVKTSNFSGGKSIVKVLLVGVGSCLTANFYYRGISNDVQAIETSVHELLPNPGAETYELGLYQSSQKEEHDRLEQHRSQRLNHDNVAVRIIYYVKYTIEDYVIDPLVSVARFVELSLIFLPVLVASPLCWFGRRDLRTGKTVRSGAQIWFAYLRWSAEVAGASFVKLGQWAASRTDIFPKEMCDELGQLHSDGTPHSLESTKRIISGSFDNLPFEEIFDAFFEKPLGVGAIAQVYIGKLSDKALSKVRKTTDWESHLQQEEDLLQDEPFLDRILVTEHNDPLTSNQYVAIKVLHPNVETKINRDLKIMKFFATVINVIPTMEWLSLPDEVEQFSMLMRLQLDLRIEGLNLAKFRHNFRHRLDIHFPKPYLGFTTRDVLVEEFIHAIPMSKMLSLSDNFGKNLSKEISDKGLDAFLKMLILDNFVHADLHPGNMMVRFYKNELFKHEREYKIVKSSNETETNRITNELMKLGDDSDAWCAKLSELYEEGYHAEICFLDVGLITELNHTDRVNFIDLFKALSEFDGYKAGELMVERSRTPETAINKEIFAIKVEKLVDRMKERTFTLGNISIGDLLDQVLGMVRNHHVRMEGDFVTVIVAILLLEGLGRQLDPELDLFARFVYALLIGFPTENEFSMFFI
ncbi:hypothetical protein PICST_52708 [Scheffersomyces stipitis CBS 6054]|uniref:ABC1 atypical kinase-like domain-containing protein n=1 Tax=Scheffersomyces stipitis (strain ATCC 58785 / CBS 6054 / NBRC 10063 / NRRL Y-11545) TaxID=322104 RepID=A3GGN0_PICST|nr:predicted protein [Scheffersomyces stipitis CBS 6054]EAZ63956.2 hypothetical protein PICST_52708 [Scheffersomyces stipitis CBS 6054]